jgi:hypothetical protein
LQMIPGWGQEPAKNISETVAGGSAKVLVVKTIADNAGQPTVQTLFSNPGTSIEVPCAIWHTQVDRSLLVSWTRGQVNK